jgi:spore germination cell wall hydrolase CwlJ-like protein
MLPHAHNIYSAAKLIDGEARGETLRGQKAVFSTILARMDSTRFPSTMHGVIYQPYSTTDTILQYNAMGDTIHENLSTEIGQMILARTAWWYTLKHLGLF